MNPVPRGISPASAVPRSELSDSAGAVASAPPAPRAYLLVFAAGLVMVTAFAAYHIAREYRNEKASWNARVTSVADDRTWIVANWLREQKADAEVLSHYPSTVALLSGRLAGGEAPRVRAEVAAHLVPLLDRACAAYGYLGVYLLDPEGEVVVRSSHAEETGPRVQAFAQAVAQSGNFRIDVLGVEPDRRHLAFTTPVFAEGGRTAVLGSVMTVVPARRLLPLLASGIVGTRTAETLLAARRGNDIVCLAPPHYEFGAAAGFSPPEGSLAFAVREGLEGREGFGEFAGRQGTRVLAATRQLPLPGWCLVHKIDREEALAGFQRAAKLDGLAAAFTLLVLAGALLSHRRNALARALQAEVERQQATLKLREYAQEIVDSIPAGLLVLSRDLRVLSVNRWFLENFQVRSEELIGRALHEVINAEAPPRRIDDVLGSSPNSVWIDLAVAGRQEHRPARITITGVPHGEEDRLLLVIEDLTESERLRAAVAASERQLRELVQSLDAILWEADACTFQISFVNQRAERILGFPVKQWLEEPHFLLNHSDPGDHEKLMALSRAAATPGGVYEFEYRMVAADGSVVWFHSLIRVVAEGRARRLRGVMVDITERKRADDALRASEERYRLLFERNLAGVYHTTLDGRILDCNESFARMFGCASREEVLAHRAWDFYFDPAEREAELARLRAQKTLSNYEARLRRKDGSTLWVLENESLIDGEEGWPEIIEGTIIDITERKHLEEQLRQGQKMEAVGRLAGGVAHDFNNLLTIISGYSQLLLGVHRAEEVPWTYAQEIKKAADRAASLTRQLLAFGRRQVLQPRALDLNAVVAELQKMLRRLISEDIELVTVPDYQLARVKADPGQIEQVILNLVVNARDAMPGGGKIIIETANVCVDDSFTRRHPVMLPGSYVSLAVSDTGTGMDAETQRHIFEPFFTTKESGKGTGLGLATVYGIIKQSGGYIWVYSEPGRGTTFKIYLPRLEEAAESAEEGEAPSGPAGGSETILLVEDEDALRVFVQGMLRSRGYQVLEARHAAEALAVCERHSGPIHLMLTDVVMPQMSGRELAQCLGPLHPEMKVLYMSGYTDSTLLHQGVLEAEASLIQKPFSPDDLSRKIREVLDGAGAGSP